MVLIEAYSIVIRTEAVINEFRGGYEEFLKIMPEGTHCSDCELERVGFMAWEGLIAFTNDIIQSSLKAERDFAVFNTVEEIVWGTCPWIEFARTPWFEETSEKFTFAWLSSEYGGREELSFAVPAAFSMVKNIKAADFISEDDVKKGLLRLKKDQWAMPCYLDAATENMNYAERY